MAPNKLSQCTQPTNEILNCLKQIVEKQRERLLIRTTFVELEIKFITQIVECCWLCVWLSATVPNVHTMVEQYRFKYGLIALPDRFLFIFARNIISSSFLVMFWPFCMLGADISRPSLYIIIRAITFVMMAGTTITYHLISREIFFFAPL